jgi:S-adenosylmethionine:tRNA ribosyltransferase-isomerase
MNRPALRENILPRDAQTKVTRQLNTLDFKLPLELEASEPPEARGLKRDEVRLMISHYLNDQVEHSQFRDISRFLQAGDVLVINTSGTMNAALNVNRADGTALELHLSTHLPADLWIVEARRPDGETTKPFYGIIPGEILTLPGDASATLHVPYSPDRSQVPNSSPRLWIATLKLSGTLGEYLDQYGFPIRYSYVRQGWPLDYYQTVYATERGSAEMPSAGRAFTAELITKLIANGIQIAPLILHTGVASLESHEPPYEEYYRVPPETARLVNQARAACKRIIAVGTTVVRTLETVTDTDRVTHPGEGWTRLIVTPERGIRAVDAMLTGMHEPKASHLAMLEALAGRHHLQVAYAEALQARYLWHEFGDLHLILP